MNQIAKLGLTLVIVVAVGAPAAEAGLATAVAREAAKRGIGGAVKKSGSASASRRALAKDAMAHLRTPARPLSQSTTVFRYTTWERARWERAHGVPRGRHMTARGGPGRPLRALRAQKRYGLPSKPEVRETIRLPKGQPVRRNKVHGGAPGEGEMTSPERVSRHAVKKVVPLP